ncbi:MAG: phenylacetate--CoA ligase family protein [Anaerolineae bacterium]
MNAFIRRQVMTGYQLVTNRRVLDRLDELNRTQWWSRDQLLDLQRDKLHRLLVNAYQYVPYYRRTFDEAGFQPDQVLSDLSSLRKLPILTKAIIRKNFDEMLTRDEKRRATMSRLTTGGSTGHPLVFMQDSNFRDYVTADIHRHLGWAGWQFGQRHAYIWGANFEVSTSQSLRTRLMDWVLNRFLTNAYVLSEESMMAFADRVRRDQPVILFGYASSIYRFAQFVREKGYEGITFKGIFSSAEVLYPGQRQFIEETFRCKMFNRYGTRDLGGVACECDAHTGLHASVENNYIEILKDGEPAQPGEAGDLIVTNLNNYGMPFIRYAIEDVGAWSPIDHCPCGREAPLMEVVQGRQIDMFKTRDGRTVWGGFASPLFGMDGVKQFQLVQKSLDLVVARIVKDGELDEAKMAEIERTVHIALGDHVQVNFEFVDEIPVLGSGKHRYAISELSD